MRSKTKKNPVREPLGTYRFESTIKETSSNSGSPLRRQTHEKYSLPRLAEGWLTLSTFDRCRKMLTFIEMVYEDFWNKCSDEDTCVEYADHLTFYA